MAQLPPFHIAFPVRDLQEARKFYGEILGCPEGRSTETWIDFNLYGHQIVAHFRPASSDASQDLRNRGFVDGHSVPIPHFGVILTMDEWKVLRDRIKHAGIKFKIEPCIRFEGEVGEQATLVFLDPSGNALEFKAFHDRSQLFANTLP